MQELHLAKKAGFLSVPERDADDFPSLPWCFLEITTVFLMPDRGI